jgi:hypothetical protein
MVATTFQPLSRKSRAVALPMPLLAPVMTMVFDVASAIMTPGPAARALERALIARRTVIGGDS